MTIAGLDYAFAAPDTLPPGPTAIALENRGEVRHEMILIRLKEGVTMEDLMAAVQGGADPGDYIEGGPGILIAAPGQTAASRLLVDLVPARTYALVCNFRDEPDAPPAIQAQAGPTTTAWLHAFLGRQYAILGRRETALRHAEKALEEYRVSVDAWNYGGLLGNLAGVYVWLGDHDRAIDLLAEKLAVENGSSAAWLRLNPAYDPLRDHPRFQALLQRYE